MNEMNTGDWVCFAAFIVFIGVVVWNGLLNPILTHKPSERESRKASPTTPEEGVQKRYRPWRARREFGEQTRWSQGSTWTLTRPPREHIPEHVRRAVWQRDGGHCARCGSTVDLQFDHIIPVSKGGATTVQNL